MARAGRRPGVSHTSDAILDAARELFAAHGFHGTTIRAIAARAGVNPALVHHYYTDKRQLLAATMRLPFDADAFLGDLLEGGRPGEDFADRLVRRFVAVWRAPVTGASLQAVLRSASGSDQGAALARTVLENLVLRRASSALGIPPERVAAAMSHLMGLAFAVTIVRLEPLASASDEELIALVTPAIRGYLTPRAR